MRLDQDAIKNFIPHREPFLFLDSIDSIELSNWKFGTKVNDPKDALGGLVTGKFYVDEKLDMFKGHFPGKPIFPGVIQVEAMAQCSSFVMSFLLTSLLISTKLMLPWPELRTAGLESLCCPIRN